MASEYKPNLGVITLTASTTLNADGYAGKIIALNAAAGLTVTLPAASGSGASFELIAVTSITSNNYVIKVANSSDVMMGTVEVASDIAGVTCPTTATSDTITMNGGTTGGVLGSRIVLTDVAANKWAVFGGLVAVGAEATPFSATV